MIDAEKCRKCGVSVWLASSTDPDVQFTIDEHACHACEYQEQHEDKKPNNERKKFGVTEFVVPIHADSELKGIAPESIPNLDWKYRYQFLHGKKPE